MARGGPSTGGSKGGGNVVPTNQPTMSDNAYRSSRPFPSGNRQPISPRSYTNIFTGPSTGFPTRGGVLRSQIPAGRGTVPDNYDYGRNMPRRFPSPQPRYPMPRNPYSLPPNRYGGMRGPTGLGEFLAQQPPIRQRQIDFGTGFPTQQQVEQEDEADTRETARQKEEERKRYQPGGSMSRTRPADEKTTYQQMLEGTYQPDDRAKSLGYTSSSGKGGSKGGARNVRSPAPGTGTIPRQPQPDIGMDPYGTQSFKIDPDILDRGTVYRPPSQISSDRPMMLENPMLFGNNPPPNYTQGLPERPMFQTQGPESLMGEIRQSQSPRFQAMQMGQAGGRPNIRPTMNVGKATGGPVGLASLIGMSNGGPTVQEGDGYRGAFNVQRMPPQTEKEARAIFDYDLEMDALNSAQEYLLNRFGRASLPEGRAPRDPATYQVDGIEELIMSSKGMR